MLSGMTNCAENVRIRKRNTALNPRDDGRAEEARMDPIVFVLAPSLLSSVCFFQTRRSLMSVNALDFSVT